MKLIDNVPTLSVEQYWTGDDGDLDVSDSNSVPEYHEMNEEDVALQTMEKIR